MVIKIDDIMYIFDILSNKNIYWLFRIVKIFCVFVIILYGCFCLLVLLIKKLIILWCIV